MKEQRPHPEFVQIEPKKIEQDLIQRYEQKTGKTLYPAQIEHLFINVAAYALSRALSGIQHTGEQLLVDYSEAPIIDYLGDLVGVTRLPAKPATTTLRFTLTEDVEQDLLIPMLTTVTDEGSGISFTTDDYLTLNNQNPSREVTATCEQPGTEGNGFGIGKLNTLQSSLLLNVTVTNTATTANGHDEESTPALRQRIKLAPESYSNAGSYGAYEFHARSAHQSIIDVAILGPQEGLAPGHVDIYPLTDHGLPNQELLTLVSNYVGAEKRRPLTDYVAVKAPERIDWQLQAKIIFYSSAHIEQVLQEAQQEIQSYVQRQQAQLGADIVPAQIIQALQIEGIYDIELILPQKMVIKPHQWAYCSAINLVVGGVKP